MVKSSLGRVPRQLSEGGTQPINKQCGTTRHPHEREGAGPLPPAACRH